MDIMHRWSIADIMHRWSIASTELVGTAAILSSYTMLEDILQHERRVLGRPLASLEITNSDPKFGLVPLCPL